MNRNRFYHALKYSEAIGAEVQCMMLQVDSAAKLVDAETAVKWFLRSDDLMEHYDERTLVILVELDSHQALRVAEAMQSTIAALESGISANIGMASTKFFDYDLDAVLTAAQGILAEASLGDSGFVCVATPEARLPVTTELDIAQRL